MVAALATPFNNWFLTKELKGGGTGERLAAWITDEPKQEAYVGPNGIWLNGKKYYWGHSVFLSLQDINLKKTSRGVYLVIKLGEDLDRSTRYFDLEIPVPSGSEFDAETVAQGILAANIILDDAHNRKEMVTYLAQNHTVSPPDIKAAKI